MNNPFTLSFGKKPLQYISRITQTNQIAEDFQSEHPSSQIYMITGVRGAGKTVLMTTIASQLREDDRWIVVELNPSRDMLQSLAAKLYSVPELRTLFLKAKLDLSAFGFGISLKGSDPVVDIETALELMLSQIKKRKKRLLITLDEAIKTENMVIFVSAFQIFLRGDLPVFLLMTGLYDNIYNLQNERSLTFLYRAPKIELVPLNLTAIRHRYQEIFHLCMDEAERMAVLTKGYPFAFQVLGYLRFQNKNLTLDELLPEYDQYLDEYVYSKIWSELSAIDKKILYELAASDGAKVSVLRDSLSMKSESFSVYRDRLRRKGVISTQEYGHLSLALPRFDVFTKMRMLSS